ncbi:MAG: DNA/RNA non-specific endonuclease [Saprospiraceae bacterium]|nr:DNA/RNA non-specific endonuclease [Saprospiraceae bacterium]
MTRLRRNHTKHKSSGMALRFIVFAIVTVFLMWYLYGEFKNFDFSEITQAENPATDSRFFLPTSNGEVIHHTYYSLSYIERHEQAEWVAYELTRDNLKVPNVKRTGRFNPDYDVTSSSAFHRDYSNSGYTRGHLAPAGDMAHNLTAMEESFLMSNISPQKRKFNNGIWKELEEQVRDWAFSRENIYIITGPILRDPGLRGIGQNGVTAPQRFYKIILDVNGRNPEAIGFIIPNDVSDQPLKDYVVTIDNIEELTGLDFFNELLNDSEEEKMESEINVKPWKFSEKRYRLRLDKWNHQ